MARDDEIRLRDRLSKLSGLDLLRGTRLSGDLERLKRQLDRIEAEPTDEEIWQSVELARHGFPLVTLVDTPGAYPGVAAEQHGQGGMIARSQAAMARLGVPSVACVIGEGGSGGAVAIAVADRVLMQENAIYSVISPEGCASILWRDAGAARKAAAAFKPDAAHCLELGVIDDVVPEPAGGAHLDHDEAARLLSAALIEALIELDNIPQVELRAARRAKFRSMGVLA